jgi:hypothetical protein
MRLGRALARARELFAESPGGAELPTALLEAFALDLLPPLISEPAVEASAELAVGTVVGDRYRIEQRIGAGGFSDVYRASDSEVEGHTVALKLLHRRSRGEKAREIALRELHLIASVFHPSIVQFKDSGWYDDRLWFVMPWYEGETLEQRIGKRPLSRAEARRIFVPLARALATLHGAGIRHQDIKPDNIFLARVRGAGPGEDEDVLPVLLDLGVAAKEAELILAGTPIYFAPEVAAQFAHVPTGFFVSGKSDVFSLALSLRDALEPESRDELTAGAIDRFVATRAETPPESPRRKDLHYLRASFERWMSVDPARRPSADELAEELAVLTLPEERRERRMRVARIVVPLLAFACAIFVAVAWQLEVRARNQAKEAEAAQARAEDARAELATESERRRELELRVRESEAAYRDSDLTRADLAQKAATFENERDLARVDLERQRARNASLAKARDDLTAQAAELRSGLDGERRRAAGLEARVVRLETDLAASRVETEAARREAAAQVAAAGALRTELAELRNRAESAEARLRDLEARARAAEQAAERASAALIAAEQRSAALERELAAARRAPPAPQPAPQPQPPPVAQPPPVVQPPPVDPNRRQTVEVRPR